MSKGLILLVGSIVAGSFSPNYMRGSETPVPFDEREPEKIEEFTPGSVLVVLTEEASKGPFDYGPSLFPRVQIKSIENLSSGNDANGYPDNFHRVLGIRLMDDSVDGTLEAIRLLKEAPVVENAEPDYNMSLLNVVPNDPSYGTQWGSSKIKTSEAWTICTGDSSTKIAVIDSGVYGGHLDLSANINSSLGGCYSSVYSNAYEDAYEHGTHVAGIIAAKGNNSKGVCGVCWDAQIVSYRISNSLTYGSSVSTYGAAQSLNDAQLKGIEFANMSFGDTTYSYALYAAIHNYSGLVVCAAGNESLDIDQNPLYPASYSLDNIISVGNSWQADLPRDASNYGAVSVDLFAPGTSIYSTGTANNNYYVTQTGTSMSAPFVTGTAALIKCANPTLSISQIKQKILSYTDYNQSFLNKCVTNGRLNLYSSLLNSLPLHDWSENYFSSIASLNPGKSQWYALTATSGAHTIQASAGASLHGSLYADPQSSPLVSGTLNSSLAYNFSYAGRYYLKVTNQSYYPGTYAINLN